MKKLFAAASVTLAMAGSAVFAQDLTIGVSWSNFQEERWKTDEAAMKAAIETRGGDAGRRRPGPVSPTANDR